MITASSGGLFTGKIMIKFEHEFETKVFLSATGCLVVEQDDGTGMKESVVFKDKKRAYAVIRAMKEILSCIQYGTGDQDGDEQ